MPSVSTISPGMSAQSGESAPSLIDVATCMPQNGITGPDFATNAGGHATAGEHSGRDWLARALLPPPSTAPELARTPWPPFAFATFFATVVVAFPAKMPLS